MHKGCVVVVVVVVVEVVITVFVIMDTVGSVFENCVPAPGKLSPLVSVLVA